jgi:hypothetical protein
VEPSENEQRLRAINKPVLGYKLITPVLIRSLNVLFNTGWRLGTFDKKNIYSKFKRPILKFKEIKYLIGYFQARLEQNRRKVRMHLSGSPQSELLIRLQHIQLLLNKNSQYF